MRVCGSGYQGERTSIWVVHGARICGYGVTYIGIDFIEANSIARVYTVYQVIEIQRFYPPFAAHANAITPMITL